MNGTRGAGGVPDTGDVDRDEALALLSDEDREWLEQMLLEYRELLDYLRDR
jgi:hypothetical protein